MTATSRAPEADGSRGQGKATSGRRRGRRRGVEIRPGSVKEARQQAGLSLGQVAREDISRTAIYFVETGKAKPSIETLQLIADRTGHPLDFFLVGVDGGHLVPAVKLAELERLMAVGDNAGAATVADAALNQKPDPETEARISLIASMANLRLARAVVGRRLAVAARTYFERTGNLYMTAESLGNEAQAASLMQDPAAVQMAEGALATSRSIKPVPQLLESRLLRVLGHALVTFNRWQEAIACYEEAIAIGDVVQDLQQLSLLYSGLSLAHQEMGQLNEATRYAQKALTIHETLQDRLSQARSLNNLGYLLVRIGEFSSARNHLERALHIFEEEQVETRKGDIIHSLAELAYREGDLDSAKRLAMKALDLTTRLGEMGTAAEAHVVMGRIAARTGHEADADREFEAALSAAEAGGGPRLSQVHEAFAEVLESRGDLPRANRHLRRALAASRPAGHGEPESRVAIA
ncbi:MAG: tetratricopeptide repeat protein [Chloroflexi bacterium]|nr:MAG: tetratricopeptide repeat protein [Chloroflexota bacterium]